MTKQEETITSWILKSLQWVDETDVAYIPYTYVTKSMFEGGVKCGLYLCRDEKEDGEITDERLTPITPAFVNLDVKNLGEEINSYILSGNITFLGYNVSITDFNLNKLDETKLEDFIEYVKIEPAFTGFGGYVPPQDNKS